MTSAGSGQQQALARAFAVARHGRLWLVPTVLCALVALFLTLLSMGGILNPNGNLRR